jgi:hypothetical protein
LTAVGAVARKICNIIFVILRGNRPYEATPAKNKNISQNPIDFLCWSFKVLYNKTTPERWLRLSIKGGLWNNFSIGVDLKYIVL